MSKISSETVTSIIILAVIGLSVAIFGKAGLIVILIPFAILSYERSKLHIPERYGAQVKVVNENVPEKFDEDGDKLSARDFDSEPGCGDGAEAYRLYMLQNNKTEIK